MNAYDNTIAYTDHIVASAISALEQRDGTIEPSLIFVWDHGESLGEYGLYLHGLRISWRRLNRLTFPILYGWDMGQRQASTETASRSPPTNPSLTTTFFIPSSG